MHVEYRCIAHAFYLQMFFHKKILDTKIIWKESSVIVAMVREEVSRDIASSVRTVHQPPLLTPHPVMRTLQCDLLTCGHAQLCSVLGLKVVHDSQS